MFMVNFINDEGNIPLKPRMMKAHLMYYNAKKRGGFEIKTRKSANIPSPCGALRLAPHAKKTITQSVRRIYHRFPAFLSVTIKPRRTP